MSNTRKTVFKDRNTQSKFDRHMNYLGRHADDCFHYAKFFRQIKDFGKAAEKKKLGSIYLDKYFRLRDAGPDAVESIKLECDMCTQLLMNEKDAHDLELIATRKLKECMDDYGSKVWDVIRHDVMEDIAYTREPDEIGFSDGDVSLSIGRAIIDRIKK